MKFQRDSAKWYQGSVALPTVILIASILLLGGINLVLLSIDIRKSSALFSQHTEARLATQTCLEEGVARLKFESEYTGSYTVESSNISCSGFVLNQDGDPETKLLTVSSMHGESHYEASYLIDASVFPLRVTRVE